MFWFTGSIAPAAYIASGGVPGLWPSEERNQPGGQAASIQLLTVMGTREAPGPAQEGRFRGESIRRTSRS